MAARRKVSAHRRATFAAAALLMGIGIPLEGRDREIRFFQLAQTAAEAAPFPPTSYRHSGLQILWNTSTDPSGAQFLLTLGAGSGSSGRATYWSGTGYGSSGGSYHPSGYLSVGLRVESPGTWRFGAGLEGRVGTENRFGYSGDTAGGGTEPPDRIRPWVIATASHQFQGTSLFRPTLGLQAGFGPEDGPYPRREAGFFAGIRF